MIVQIIISHQLDNDQQIYIIMCDFYVFIINHVINVFVF